MRQNVSTETGQLLYDGCPESLLTLDLGDWTAFHHAASDVVVAVVGNARNAGVF